MGAAQLKRYVEWGLLWPDADGKFEEADQERLTAILKAQRLGGQILPRTVLRLAFDRRFHIPAASLRRAAVAMAGPEVIRSPVWKLRQLAEGQRALADRLTAATYLYRGAMAGKRTGIAWAEPEPVPRVRVPSHRQWQSLLTLPEISDDEFGCYFEQAVAADEHGRTTVPEAWPKLTLEERLVGLLILALVGRPHVVAHGGAAQEPPE